jgi:hypothetical protein
MSFYFAFDEHTDVVSKEDAMKICHTVIKTMRTCTAVKEIIKIAEMARQYVFSLHYASCGWLNV